MSISYEMVSLILEETGRMPKGSNCCEEFGQMWFCARRMSLNLLYQLPHRYINTFYTRSTNSLTPEERFVAFVLCFSETKFWLTLSVMEPNFIGLCKQFGSR
ncbi:hypothetical protein DPMN_146466 [Dreissena polymorpha]|uniref:Uncharacterized protein n=1 Tax=Dreissena polymorpha TaxID=45954 RepID=A0A9D4J205_DREPO|nr:hypothetical protein DPMN_146466 [Dreissena polymorpha]